MEEISFKIADSAEDFNQILALQKQNLYTAIEQGSPEQKGFVFAEHTLALLQQMATVLPQIVAVANRKVIGYNLAMNSHMKNYLPSLIPMFNEFEKFSYNGKPLNEYTYVIGGQVCVDQSFRGRGLIKQLYLQTQKELQQIYEICVTEISTRNMVSLKAHQKMGFEIIGSYNDGLENWHIVLLDFNKHPLS